jgi:arginine-tRNA-protein transferase
LVTLGEHPCPYLPGRAARNRAFLCESMPTEVYHELMDAAFRRSGQFIYQPVCPGCRECQPIRVLVDQFTPSKSQRRAWRRNSDLTVTVDSPPQPSEEKFNLYTRYLRGRHERHCDPQGDDDFQNFVEFLYQSPVDTIEITYRLADDARTLVGVGICDRCAGRSLSSVYFYFDPGCARRGLGTFSSMWEIDFARRHNIPYYYLGYHVRGCDSMSYKASFRPNELLHPDGVWRDDPRQSAGQFGANFAAPEG